MILPVEGLEFAYPRCSIEPVRIRSAVWQSMLMEQAVEAVAAAVAS